MSSCLQFLADAGSSAILPNDGAVNGHAGHPVPNHGRLPLIGDADRCNFRGLNTCLFDGLPNDRKLGYTMQAGTFLMEKILDT